MLIFHMFLWGEAENVVNIIRIDTLICKLLGHTVAKSKNILTQAKCHDIIILVFFTGRETQCETRPAP